MVREATFIDNKQYMEIQLSYFAKQLRYSTLAFTSFQK